MSRKYKYKIITNFDFYSKPGLCETCEHAVPRHYDAHHTKKRNKYELICLLTGKPVSRRGWPKTINEEIYPCRYTGKADGYVKRGSKNVN